MFSTPAPSGKARCFHCQQPFKPNEVVAHQERCASTRPCRCNLCGRRFQTPTGVSRHQGQAHSGDERGTLHNCPYPDCFYGSDSQTSLQQHLNRHQKGFRRSLSRTRSLSRSRQPSVNREMPMPQQMRGAVAGNSRQSTPVLRSRQGSVNRSGLGLGQQQAIGPVPCDVCGRQFDSKMSMRIHQSTVHSGVEIGARYCCEEPNCTFGTNTLQGLQRHRDRHLRGFSRTHTRQPEAARSRSHSASRPPLQHYNQQPDFDDQPTTSRRSRSNTRRHARQAAMAQDRRQAVAPTPRVLHVHQQGIGPRIRSRSNPGTRHIFIDEDEPMEEVMELELDNEQPGVEAGMQTDQEVPPNPYPVPSDPGEHVRAFIRLFEALPPREQQLSIPALIGKLPLEAQQRVLEKEFDRMRTGQNNREQPQQQQAGHGLDQRRQPQQQPEQNGRQQQQAGQNTGQPQRQEPQQNIRPRPSDPRSRSQQSRQYQQQQPQVGHGQNQRRQPPPPPGQQHNNRQQHQQRDPEPDRDLVQEIFQAIDQNIRRPEQHNHPRPHGQEIRQARARPSPTGIETRRQRQPLPSVEHIERRLQGPPAPIIGPSEMLKLGPEGAEAAMREQVRDMDEQVKEVMDVYERCCQVARANGFANVEEAIPNNIRQLYKEYVDEFGLTNDGEEGTTGAGPSGVRGGEGVGQHVRGVQPGREAEEVMEVENVQGNESEPEEDASDGVKLH